MTLIAFADVAIRALITCIVLQVSFAAMTFWERKIMAWMQWRKGPNRTGPLGVLQPIADGLKLLFKEQLIPAEARPFIFLMAPVISLVVALTSFAVIPVQTEPLNLFFGLGEVRMVVADVNVGVMVVLAISSLSVYGMVLGGWASGNKYSLIGAVRSSAQMISYELALGTALLSPLMMIGSLSFVEIADFQMGSPWIVFSQPMAFVLFCIAAVAETNRAPFDLPEAEQELGAGFHTEYSGMRFALFFMAEYTAMMTISGIAITVFLGGPSALPGLEYQSWIFFVLKMMGFMFFFIWLRATLPRFRYDQLMKIGWTVLFPLGVINLGITCVGVVLGWLWYHYTIAICGTVAVLYVGGKLNRRRDVSH